MIRFGFLYTFIGHFGLMNLYMIFQYMIYSLFSIFLFLFHLFPCFIKVFATCCLFVVGWGALPSTRFSQINNFLQDLMNYMSYTSNFLMNATSLSKYVFFSICTFWFFLVGIY
ncbi:uncharacterized protein V1516DRAFT_56519 [Lipomyces oligophaga]|uniref:uncharacterized protein n=1 Tax=Lipomyces oligophaga TaxID=45792 RepID=UPI0034CF2403